MIPYADAVMGPRTRKRLLRGWVVDVHNIGQKISMLFEMGCIPSERVCNVQQIGGRGEQSEGGADERATDRAEQCDHDSQATGRDPTAASGHPHFGGFEGRKRVETRCLS